MAEPAAEWLTPSACLNAETLDAALMVIVLDPDGQAHRWHQEDVDPTVLATVLRGLADDLDPT